MGSKPDFPNPLLTAELVAYLDGELADPEAQVIARRATADEETRREVDALRETWGLLDHLPLARADEDFGTRTLTALRVDEGKSSASTGLASGTSSERVRRWQVVSLAVIVLATTALSTWLTGRVWPGRDTRLVRKLSLAEHLDDYRVVGSIEFLRWLDESDTFDDAE